MTKRRSIETYFKTKQKKIMQATDLSTHMHWFSECLNFLQVYNSVMDTLQNSLKNHSEKEKKSIKNNVTCEL